jgi:ubiquinone/menaquinone biosynthesis C-methylase UbiE
MKGRESAMPEEIYWHSFYDADCIVENLECAKNKRESIAEFGSGYGTFTFPAAKRTSGVVHVFDIEPQLVTRVRRRAQEFGLSNIRVEVRDFVAHGTGLPSRSIDHAMLYNLLHIEEPVRLLKEAFRILKPGGVLSIIHWKYDPTTPRGPSMAFVHVLSSAVHGRTPQASSLSAIGICQRAAPIIMGCSWRVLTRKKKQPNKALAT